MTNIQVYEETLTFVSTFQHSHTHHSLAGWDFEFSLLDAPPHLLFKSLVVTIHVSTPSISLSPPFLLVLIYWHLRQNRRRQCDTNSPESPVHQNIKIRLCFASIWSNFSFSSDSDIFLWPSEEPYFCPMICQETPQDFVLLQALTHLSNTARHKLWCQAPWHSYNLPIHTHFFWHFFIHISALSKPMWKSPHENHFTDFGSSSF